MESDFLTRCRTSSSVPIAHNANIRDLLQEYYDKSVHFESRKFLPVLMVKELLTKKVILQWVQDHSLHSKSEIIPCLEDTINKIVNVAPLLFAVLILKKLEHLTYRLLESGVNDDSLFQGIDCSKISLDAAEKNALTAGLRMVAPVFKEGKHLDLPSETILPFEIRHSIKKSGASGSIYRLQITSGHLGGNEKVLSSIHSDRKAAETDKPKKVVAEKKIRIEETSYEISFKTIYREVETLQKRQHPNIVRLLASYTLITDESGVDIKSLHLIQPFAESDLAEWMNMESPPEWLGKQSPSERRSFLYGSIFGLISGLSYLHREKDGLVTAHHDLKPKNILIIRQELIIADFGRSHLRPWIDGSETLGADGLGTYEYHPPEFWKDNGTRNSIQHGRAFDCWSVGCIIIELATLLVYGWTGKVAEFRTKRREQSPKLRPKLASTHDPDTSFHNNLTAVKAWITELRQEDGGSFKFEFLLDLALGLMGLKASIVLRPESRIYAWEAELDMNNMQQPDDDRASRLGKGALRVQPPRRRDTRPVIFAKDIETPLHRAARKRPPDIGRFKLLWECGWDRSVPDANNLRQSILADSDNANQSAHTEVPLRMTPSIQAQGLELLRAAAAGNLEEVQDLLEDGVDVMFVDEKGRSALFAAVDSAQNVNDVVDLLLKTQGIGLLSLKEYEWLDTPLHRAASLGRVEITKQLLGRCPRLEDRQKQDKTPLFVAVEWGRVEVVRILLEYGAQLFTQRDTKGTPLHAAVSQERPTLIHDTTAIINLLLAHPDAPRCLEHKNIHGDTPFYLAVSRSNIIHARLLKNKGASLHVCNVGNVNVLHWTAQNNLHDFLREIIDDFGRDELMARNRPWGDTPIDIARNRGNRLVLDILERRLAEC